MALADILKRIDSDAEADANTLLQRAERDAGRIREDAEASGAQYRTSETERAEREVAEEARTRLAGARLRGRDRVLAEKRALIERVLATATDRIVNLPDADYVALMAREIAAASRGGERVVVGSADAGRLGSALQAALDAAGANVTLGGASAELERGVMLEGDRMRVEISPAALIDSRRGELEAHVMESLFGGEES